METALRPLSFLLEVLGGRVSPRRKGHPKEEAYQEGLPESYDCVVSHLDPSQRYSMIKDEEACRL